MIALHCKAGKGRTGLMSACFLVYMLDALNAHEAIDFYGTTRTFNKKGVTIPSQLKYINYWSASLKHRFTIGERTVKLVKIEMTPTPKIADEIFVRISTFHEFVCEKSLTNNRKLTFKQIKDARTKMKEEDAMRLYDEIYAELREERGGDVSTREAICAWDWKLRTIEGDERFGNDGSSFPIDPVTLHGDIKLEFLTSKGGVFNIWFNTWFIHDGVLEFSKMELDKGFKDDKQLAPNFKVILHFEDVSTAPAGEQEIPCCQVGIRTDIPDDVADPADVPARPTSVPTDPDADAARCLLAETESENAKRVKVPQWFPVYHTSLNFKNFNRVVEHLIKYPGDREFFNINPEMETVKETERDPLEVSRSVLYSIIQLYLRSGFYGRVLDYHVEMIMLDNRAGVQLFEQQASELAVVDLGRLGPGESEPFWLNVYHTMLLHGLLYWRHRPAIEFKDMLQNFRRFAYKVGGLSYTLHEVLLGCLRAPWPKDSGIDKPVAFGDDDPRRAHVVREADKYMGCLISFGTTSSPGIWLYSAEDFADQREVAVNTYLNRQAAALGLKRDLYVMGNMKMFAKDFGGEAAMKKDFLARHGVPDHEVKKWNIKYQAEDRETRLVLDHLIAQNIVVTHRQVNFFGQANLFAYEKPSVKDPRA